MKQQTIKNSVSTEGIGLHSGANVKITLHPADENHGIKFKRTDLSTDVILPADANKVVASNRGTVIKVGDATISTVEHLLSALTGLEIDNILIEINGPEVPILEGSAQPFVELIESAGILTQEADCLYLQITESLHFKDDNTDAEYYAHPADEFKVTGIIEFDSKFVGQQIAILDNIQNYKSAIAPARTFVFLHEIAVLLEQNLIKGGDLDNAIVIVNEVPDKDTLRQLALKLNKPDIAVSREGILNHNDLRFPNELARHKTLDVIGDLALVGKRIKGKVIAIKPGHTSNVEFAKFLKKYHAEQLKDIPRYDPNATPIYDSVGIAKLLPHRYPFLLVDKIIELGPDRVVGVKNVTFNEQFFQGHFPNNPVMPGVLQIEAMAQVGGILALLTVENPGLWDTYFLKIDDTKFKQKVVPGDTLIFKLELLEPIRRGIVVMKGSAYVGNKLVSEAHLTAQIVRRPSNEASSV
ncbi:MAG: bifunctional UDP-3-O-[3-hydroxymyristoyl] N-acetylglucosamine deacetylase/3-hydroxyacyl-ACP dehydratase [Saprospiraceae bacterium]